VYALFIATILAMETNIFSNNEQGKTVAKNQFVTLNKHIHQIIFRYLNLYGQGTYSGLTRAFYEKLKFRKIFLILLTNQLIIGLSPSFRNIEDLAVESQKTVMILAESTLQERSLILKKYLSEFNYYVHLLTKSKRFYTPEENDIMAYVEVLMQDQKNTQWITYMDQKLWHQTTKDYNHVEKTYGLEHRIVTEDDAEKKYNFWFYKYNLQDQTLFSSFTTRECIYSEWTHQAKFAMPLYIEYLLNDEEYVDVLAEYPICDFTVHKDGSQHLDFISDAVDLKTSHLAGYPKIKIMFQLNELLNDIKNVNISVCTGKYFYECASYIIKDGNLIKYTESKNQKVIEIQSITTTNSSLTKKKNKFNFFMLKKIIDLWLCSHLIFFFSSIYIFCKTFNVGQLIYEISK
jgi:hypothetical protein